MLATSHCPCDAQNYRYSFEGNFEGWAADACDDMPGPNWHIIPTQAAHYSGAWALELYLANYNDATKIWIEKPFLVQAGGIYNVRVRWQFASSDWGMANLFSIIASISGKDPETRSDFTVIGNTGNGDFHYYVWLPKEYAKNGVAPIATDEAGVGVIWVAFGVWGTWETPRTYYVDYTLVDITPIPPTQTVSVGGARGLRDGSIVRI
ncbi:MAG: hypothetical protein NTU88_11915, partial [Armatimonadetes bacterium]|nr:hypothetical protein [Armatimonadota bacterium]